MRFMPLHHRSFQLMLLILSLYMVHAHYSELDAIYAFNSQPSQKALAWLLKGPMAEWHKPHEAIHVIVGSLPEST